MARILILYGTNEGHTAKIVNHIAAVAKDKGHAVRMIHGKNLPSNFSPEEFEAVIIGASIHVGKHQRYVRDFVKVNLAMLERVPSALFSTSLTAGAKREEDRVQAEQYVEKFMKETGWKPDKVGIFAGALLYTQYGFIKRFILKMITKRAGGDTDTSRDYEYTDWESVTGFAEDFLASLQG